MSIQRCERCGKVLDPDKTKWLELNSTTGIYTDPEVTSVPEEESQGCFAFGNDCAKHILANGGKVVLIGIAKTYAQHRKHW